MARNISSPGVTITETDLSISNVAPVGNNTFITGFAAKGPTDQLITVTSTKEFEQIFGTPTTAAERYLYYTAKQILDSGVGSVLVSRLPYGPNAGDGFGSYYSALVYPVTTYNGSAFVNDISTANSTYFLGEPKLFQLTQAQYLSAIDGTGFSWSSTSSTPNQITGVTSFGGAGLVILNKAQLTTNTRFEGYYVGLADNTNLLPTTDYNGLVTVKSVASSANVPPFVTLPSTRLDFTLSATKSSPDGSISEAIENIATFDTYDAKYNDTLSLGVFKLFQSPFASDTILLDYSLAEGYNGSVDYYRQINNVNGGNPKSFFISQVSKNSTNVTVLVNDNISNRSTNTWLNSAGVPSKAIRVLTNAVRDQYTINSYVSANVGVAFGPYLSAIAALGTADAIYAIGAYTDQTYTNKQLGSIPTKLDRALQKIENDETVQADLLVEAGLGTIYAVARANAHDYYDDTEITAGLTTGLAALTNTNDYVATGTSSDLRTSYATIFNKFVNIAENVRKDCLFIADPIRHIFVSGESTKVLSDSNKSFSQYIYSALRHQFEVFNTSYAATYANWALINDGFTGVNAWVPFSGYAAVDIINSPFPWSAPAGFTRGRVIGASDLAIIPRQKERDQLYKLGINPVTLFSGEGFVIYGQKTMLKQPSAFDRINVRRLFIYLEKATKQTAAYFVFEPNTLYTRSRFVNTLTPIFETAKNPEAGGLYDYLIVADTRNNTPDVIDRNELVADIYVKPVRTAEFINVNFYATRTGTNFTEIIG